jgi:transposase
MEQRRKDWTGQTLYAGIDVHRAKWVVTVRTKDVQLKTFATGADKQALLRSFRHLFPGATVEAVYEAGCFGYHLAQFLNANDVKTIIVAPHTIPVAPGQFVKTDVIDSRKLASELAKGSLRGIYIPATEILYDRSLLRKRRQLVKRRVQLHHQVSSDLRFYGRDTEVTFRPHWSRWLIADLKAMQFPNENYREVFQMLVDDYVTIRDQIRQLDRILITVAESDKYRRQVALLRTIPGIGRLAALTFLLEIGDMKRFSSAEKFASYLGLTPSEFSSGEHVRKGSLTGMGHSALRSLLVQTAWQSIKKDPVLLMKFQHLCAGKSRCQAIIPIAKSLANRLRRVLLFEEPYVVGVA